MSTNSPNHIILSNEVLDRLHNELDNFKTFIIKERTRTSRFSYHITNKKHLNDFIEDCLSDSTVYITFNPKIEFNALCTLDALQILWDEDKPSLFFHIVDDNYLRYLDDDPLGCLKEYKNHYVVIIREEDRYDIVIEPPK